MFVAYLMLFFIKSVGVFVANVTVHILLLLSFFNVVSFTILPLYLNKFPQMQTTFFIFLYKINFFVFLGLFWIFSFIFFFADPMFFLSSAPEPLDSSFTLLNNQSSVQFESIFYTVIDPTALLFILLLFFLIVVCIIIGIFVPFQSLINSLILPYKSSLSSSLFFLKFNPNPHYSKFLFTTKNNSLIILLSILSFVLFLLFSTTNLFIFYLFFETSMIPVFFMIGIFGSRINKIKASFFLFFFTVMGSISFLTAIFILKYLYNSVSIFSLLSVSIPEKLDKLLWLLIFLPMSVKVPIFPFHIWLPEAHVEASTEGSVLLAGLLLKVGLFGMIRFLVPLFPHSTLFFFPFVSLVSVLSILFISCTIFIQLDIKKIIAYSSIAHMNFALIGLLSSSSSAIQGSIFLMFTHGIISSGLFIVAGFIYARFHTRTVSYIQGLVNIYPVIASLFFVLILGNAGIPGTGGFIGEILIIFGIIQKNFFIAVLMLVGPLLATIYSLLLFVRIFLGPISKSVVSVLTDQTFTPASSFELYTLIIFAFFTLQTGIFPSIYLKKLTPIAIALSSNMLN